MTRSGFSLLPVSGDFLGPRIHSLRRGLTLISTALLVLVPRRFERQKSVERNSCSASCQRLFKVMVYVFVRWVRYSVYTTVPSLTSSRVRPVYRLMTPPSSCSASITEPSRSLPALCSPGRRQRIHPQEAHIVATSAPSTLTDSLAPHPLSHAPIG